MISRVRVRNFKSLRSLDLVLSNLTVLIGRNGAGKSNILDALSLLANLMRFSVGGGGDPIR